MGFFQARVLEWVPLPSPQPQLDNTSKWVLHVLPHLGVWTRQTTQSLARSSSLHLSCDHPRAQAFFLCIVMRTLLQGKGVQPPSHPEPAGPLGEEG